MRSEAQLTELVSNPDARRVVIDKELVETAKLFKGAEFDRRTLLDFDATPTASSSDEDGPRERKSNAAWRLMTAACSPTATAIC